MSKDIEALIERLEKATGGDTRLDRAILEWEGWNPNGEFMKQKRWIDPSGRVTAFNSDLEPVHFYTSSVDAALALCERIKPGAEMAMKINHPVYEWQTATIRVGPLKSISGEGATLPWPSSSPFSALSIRRKAVLRRARQLRKDGWMSSELKPCPFCGSAFKSGQEPHDNHPVGGMFYIYHDYGPIGSPARSCPLEFRRHFDTMEAAAMAWNTRLPEPPTGGRVDE